MTNCFRPYGGGKKSNSLTCETMILILDGGSRELFPFVDRAPNMQLWREFRRYGCQPWIADLLPEVMPSSDSAFRRGQVLIIPVR
jgi:hypothetical protein